MAPKVQIVRMLAAALVALAACLFVSYYNWAFALTLERGIPLPRVTRQVVESTPYVYGVPVCVLFFGTLLLRGKRERAVVFESLIAFAWLASFVWVLIALWVWQLTRIEIMDHIR